MDATTLLSLLLACAPEVHPETATALVRVESNFNPWAIGVVGGALPRQPRHHAEALAAVRTLQDAGRNFSVGLAQINVGNWARLGLTASSAFEPCRNLAAMQRVLTECFDRARRAPAAPNEQQALRRALSCYYSGNFSTGFRHGYVRKVVLAAQSPSRFVPPHP
ncbi:MAG: lytic transglycosylase domain-containing protein [Hydrogenophaga sp.]|nr:lytic transglycosylase domain-containing protein [Hydrogenophaga sp.]